MKKAKFQTKLIFYNVLIFIMITVLVMGLFYYFLVNNISQRMIADFEALANKSAGQMDTLLYNMDKTALQIAANPNVVNCFNAIPKDENTNYFIEEPLVASRMIKLLNSYNFKKDGNTRVLLYNDNDDFVYSATTMTTGTAIENFFSTQRYQQTQKYFLQTDAYSLFQTPSQDIFNDSALPSPAYIAIVREIKDYFTGVRKNGYVEVQQDVARIDQIFSDLGEGCHMALADSNGKIVYYGPSMQGENSDSREKWLQTLAIQNLKQGISRQDGAYVARYSLQEAPIDILMVKESSALLAPIKQFSVVLFGALIAVLLITILSEVLIIKRLSRPLVALNRSVKNITIDNMKLELDDTTDSDELQQLDVAFNKMLAHLQHAMDRQLVSQTNELKAHVFALHSQMNPHFIYNVLAIISMEAQADGNDKIIKMCAALSGMMSFSASMGDGFCTMQSEFVHAGHYMELMKQRYEDQFEYTISITDACKEVRIPKLIVQPLCENCFKHAFINKEDLWRIRVYAYTENQRWFITVEDNGAGFTAQYLTQFSEMARTVTLQNVKEKMEHLSIGGLCLPNIFIRLKLLYKEQFVCKIENISGGCRVVLGGAVDDTNPDC